MYSNSGLLYRIRITVTSSNILIGVRIKNDICIRVRVTGIRVQITSRVRIAEVVLGCSGHYIDPKKMPKNSSQTFKSNTFVSRTVHILKVPRVNLELWYGLCWLASLPKGINQRYCLSNQSCQQTRRSQEI